MDTLLADNRVEALMNTIVDGAAIIDPTGMVLSVNPACAEMFGYRVQQIIGQNVRMLMPPKIAAEHDGYLDNYIRTSDPQIIGIGREVEGQRADGTVFPLDLAVGEMQIDDGQYFVGILRDLTQRRERQAEFDALQGRHFHLSRVAAMNEMGATIAHEINQPLSATANYIETARLMLERDTADTEPAIRILDSAINQNQRAADIIARMRRFIERGDVSLHVFDLEQVIDDALMIGLSKEQRQTVEVDRQVATITAVNADPVQVQQVLVNLIRNACEAMLINEDRRVEIRVMDDPEDIGFLRISVSDSGPGIAPDVIPDLFTAFTSSKPGGLGVGLSISQSIIRAHKGKIWAENPDDGGARFTFTLPKADA